MSKVKGIYKLKAGNKTHNIKFDMNALVELEDVTGLTISEFGELAQSGKIGIKMIRAMLWAGLLNENPEVSIYEAGDILEKAGLQESAKLVSEALAETLNGGQKPASGKSEVVEPGKN